MKKIAGPFIHVLFLIPLLIIAMGSIELMARHFGLLPNYIRVFEMPYLLLTLGIIVISSIPLFWLANRLMQSLEKLKQPSIYDHFRQSIFFYLIIVYSISIWIFASFKASVDNLYFLTLTGFSVISIVFNYIFLTRFN